jgi:phosphopantetheine adenylyltransferase
MLSESVLLTQNRMLIGIACENLLSKKVLSELLEDIDVRCKNVRGFLNTIAPNLELVIEPITEPFGPSVTEKDYQVILFFMKFIYIRTL